MSMDVGKWTVFDTPRNIHALKPKSVCESKRKREWSWDMEPCGFTHMVDALMGVLFESLPS